MRSRASRGLLLLAAFVSAAALDASADNRTTVRFRYLCSNELGRRDITLFASGTVRLRQGLWNDQEMNLDELSPEQLDMAVRVVERRLKTR